MTTSQSVWFVPQPELQVLEGSVPPSQVKITLTCSGLISAALDYFLCQQPLLGEESQGQGPRAPSSHLSTSGVSLPYISSLLPDPKELEIIDDWLEEKHLT